MMAQVARLAGAILLQSGEEFFLIGNPKVPCNFDQAGFCSPDEIDACRKAWVRLVRGSLQAQLPQPVLEIGVEGDAAANLMARRFLIERNGSVSERLWSLVTDNLTGAACDWLVEMPDALWQVIRDAVLRCS